MVNMFCRLCLKPDKSVSYPFAWVSPGIHRMTLFVAPVGDFLTTQLAPVSPRSYQEVTRNSEWAEPPTTWSASRSIVAGNGEEDVDDDDDEGLR